VAPPRDAREASEWRARARVAIRVYIAVYPLVVIGVPAVVFAATGKPVWAGLAFFISVFALVALARLYGQVVRKRLAGK
jgi:integral membrane sensor domain MASE1